MLDAVLRQLAPYARTLEPVFSGAARGFFRDSTTLKSMAALCGHSTAKLPQLEEALRKCVAVGAVVRADMGLWFVRLDTDDCNRLALMLRGINIYRDHVHKDKDTVSVVISHPAQPSKLVKKLEQTLQGTWGLAETADSLVELARKAECRFTVMTPFVDEDGAKRILELLELTKSNVKRELIVRNGLPAALQERIADLQRLNTKVYDFRIARDEGGGTETFHAKVVCIDAEECYVGSSNMTEWSFSYSLELGFCVRGAAGRRVAQVVDAVLQVSQELSL